MPPVAQYLAKRYAHAPVDRALDIYAATFLTPLSELTEADCPRLAPPLRAAFATAHEALGALVSPDLMAHRTMILERHLGWPIEI